MTMTKTRRFIGLAMAGIALASARTAVAGPVEAGHVAADAKWYVHLDAEAAKQTVLFKDVLELVRAKTPLEEQLDQLKQVIGINPLTDIAGITVYNTSFEQDVLALLIYAKVDQVVLAGLVAQSPDYKEQAYGKHKLMTWTDANDGKHKAGVFYKDGLIVMANSAETAKGAVDVLDGTKQGNSALVQAQPKGNFFSGAATLGLSPDQNVSRLLSNSEAATAAAGEVDGRIRVVVNLVAKSAEDGAQLKTLLEGLKAMAVLGAHQTPTAGKLVQQVKLSAEGVNVTGVFEHDSKDAIETLKKLDEENKAKRSKSKGEKAPVDRTKPEPAAGGL
ncbi:MAG TPA: hypothetical protein VEA69_18310 [Tepidisphaeraceae bacterium]|nr:hypothetical protein [Tepidisphaeraceae bacterium]